ncbi:MAG: Uma2 family endonuclease [Pyrinomonadaceae bacterium]
MNPNPIPKMTPEEFLAFERASDIKHEYLGGQIVAMGGAKRNHNIVALNLGGDLNNLIEEKDCEAYLGDMRVFLPATSDYAYPDITLVCGEPVFQDDVLDTLINPLLIIEVLSESTEAYDRGLKFRLYRSIDTLHEYVLISQDQPRIEKYNKKGDGFWVLSETSGIDSELQLESIGVAVPLSRIYRKVRFEESDEPIIRPLQ